MSAMVHAPMRRPGDARCDAPAAPADVPLVHFEPLDVDDLDAVVAVEAQCYSHPWTRGNFVDSLAAGHVAERLTSPDDDALVGYFVAMPVLDELHLLNVTVAPAWRGRGHGRALLERVEAVAAARAYASVWLEVRVGNERARALYALRGYREVGRRRDYYPATRFAREDAVVMTLECRR